TREEVEDHGVAAASQRLDPVRQQRRLAVTRGPGDEKVAGRSLRGKRVSPAQLDEAAAKLCVVQEDVAKLASGDRSNAPDALPHRQYSVVLSKRREDLRRQSSRRRSGGHLQERWVKLLNPFIVRVF